MALPLSDLLMLGSGEKRLAACVVLLLLELFLDGAEAVPNQADIDNHLELGKEFLARGQLSDALTHYHAAVEGDANNYLTLFKRGTVYLALGKTRFAIQDFSRVLELKPDFTAARAQRGLVHMKSGEYDEALTDFSQVLREEPNNGVVFEQYSRLEPAKEQWYMVEQQILHGDYHNAINLITQLLELSPWSVPFRQTRSDLYIKVNDAIAAISDLRQVNRLTQDSTEGHYNIAKLLYTIGHAPNALKEIRECLKFDPEHKLCFPFYKKLRKVEKQLSTAEQAKEEKQYSDCTAAGEAVLKHEPEETMIRYEAHKLLCNCYTGDEEFGKALTQCKEALEIMKEAQVYCDRADALIGTEMYDDAIHSFQAALELDENSLRAKEGIQKAKKLQKQAERRDYYKILGVKRTATKQEIVKAYRKAAQKWHPDNFRDEEKKVAEKKFIDIAAAKEVLTDPEKRRQFDEGEDPLDPEANQRGGGQHPFAHFQHGSPFQFKFHFN
ncbi:dnaJ homolog subfamily C member 3 [Drosophila guanche]|uniref:Blast:DnaJ homolog subfamily C member 3 n=1 Tax=Drosophila guanche TaxID=7266 RepID=A0A3B0JQE1_DROGU|nr:dnaJ homolog subfamily C member 3 [Drosophila guanche]SPP84345.1 blast:DnaJ homolog subfamily C member 3 [Drosophila guanche]